MCGKSDRTSIIIETHKTISNHIEQKKKRKYASEENRGRGNEKKRSAEMSRRSDYDVNEGNEKNEKICNA